MSALAGPELDRPHELVSIGFRQLGLRVHHQGIVASDRAVQAFAVTADPRPDLTVVKPWGDAQLELDRAPLDLDHAQQLAAAEPAARLRA